VKIDTRETLKQFNELLIYDPGGTTGYARIRLDREGNSITIFEAGEFANYVLAEDHLNKLNKENTIFLYESIVINTRYPTPQEVRIPIEMIGVLKYLCTKLKITYFEQDPARRKAAELWYPKIHSLTSHHGSACRHGIVFAVDYLMPKQPKMPEIIFDKQTLFKR